VAGAARFTVSVTSSKTKTSYFSASQPITLMAWIYTVTNGGAGAYRNWFGEDGAVVVATLNNTLILGTPTQDITGGTVTTGQWHHYAWTRSGNSHTVYVDGVSSITGTDSAASTTLCVARFDSGDLAADRLDGRIAHLKGWNAVLTVSEIFAEMAQGVPVRRANLAGFHYFGDGTSDTTLSFDFSGLGQNLTTGGTAPTVEDGPPVPWSLALRQAISFNSVPPASMVSVAWLQA
jgi:hypothetical protein